MPEKLLPYFGSLLSSSARSYLDVFQQRMLSPVSEAGRYVDPVFQHNRRHCAGFSRNLVKAGSIGFVEDAVEHVFFFFNAKMAGGSEVHH